MSVDVESLLRKLPGESWSPGQAGPGGQSLSLLPQLARSKWGSDGGGSQAAARAPTKLEPKAPPSSHSQAGLYPAGWWTLSGAREVGQRKRQRSYPVSGT